MPDAGPVVLVGCTPWWLGAVERTLPPGSVVVVDEPDVVRKRGLHAVTAASPPVRDLIEWEYQRPGAADEFAAACCAGPGGLRPSAVVPVIDYATPFAARLAERLGLPGAGFGAATLLRDKRLQREVTAAAGVVNPRSAEIAGPAEARALLAEVGPIVLKPANRQAALGVVVVRAAADVDAAWAEAAEQDEGVHTPDRPMPVRILAERLVVGDEYSVEMLVRDGRPLFGGVTRKHLFAGRHPVERGHVHPADVPDELTARLLADTALVVDAVGMGTGAVHCEWIVDGGVPHLVECAGRLGGGGIVDLVERAWGCEVYRSLIDLLAGREPAPFPGVAPRSAAVWYASAPPGEVVEVDGLDAARAVPGVDLCAALVGPGDTVGELRSGWDRVALARAVADTAARARAAARTAVERVRVTVRSDADAPEPRRPLDTATGPEPEPGTAAVPA